MKRILLSLPLLLLACGALAQTPLDIEIGYRFSNVSGNEDLYRSQINEREGFVIRALTFFSSAPAPGVDHFRIDATDLGNSPASVLRIDAGLENTYRLRLGYRAFDSFDALPGVESLHTFDRTRRMFDADLELLPGRRITPFVGYSWSTNEGPGRTTYALGGDEFRLDQQLDESEREIRAGAAFHTKRFSGVFTQGWRSLKSDETFTLSAGASDGNNAGTVLGRSISGTPSRSGRIDVDTPFTNFYVTADATQRVRVIADYVRFAAESKGIEDESDTGSFMSFPLGRTFSGLEETVTSRAKNTTWRGGVRGEIAIADRFGVLVGWRTERRTLDGTALVDSLYRDTLTFAGFDPKNIHELLDAESAIERDSDTFEAAFNGRALGPFAFRLGVSEQRQDFNISPDAAEVAVPGGQGGVYARGVRTYDASVTYAQGLFSGGVALRRDDADRSVLRTDFLDRNRVRLRAGFHTPNDMLRLGISGEKTDQSNDRPEVGYDADAKQYTADVEYAPMTMLRLRGSYSQLRGDSTIRFRRPETFVIDTSRQREDGEAIEGGVALALKDINLDASVSRYDNEGTLPFSFDRYRMRVAWKFLAAEWSRDNYEEDAAASHYDADRYGVFFILHHVR